METPYVLKQMKRKFNMGYEPCRTLFYAEFDAFGGMKPRVPLSPEVQASYAVLSWVSLRPEHHAGFAINVEKHPHD